MHYPVQTAQGTDYVWASCRTRTEGCGSAIRRGFNRQAEPAALVAAGGGAHTWACRPANSEGAGVKEGRVKVSGAGDARGARLLLPDSPGEARWYTTDDGWPTQRAGAAQVCRRPRLGRHARRRRERLRRHAFRNYAAAHGVGSRVNALAEDRDGNVWVGTQTKARRRLRAAGSSPTPKAKGSAIPTWSRLRGTGGRPPRRQREVDAQFVRRREVQQACASTCRSASSPPAPPLERHTGSGGRVVGLHGRRALPLPRRQASGRLSARAARGRLHDARRAGRQQTSRDSSRTRAATSGSAPTTLP